MVYRREIDGKAVAFGHQGAIWSHAMTMYDHLTGSVWSQPYGAPFMGELVGMELDLVPSTMTTWAEWKRLNPHTLAYTIGEVDTSEYESEVGEMEQSAIVVEYFDEAVSYPMPDLRVKGVINDVVGGLPIAVTLTNGGETWQVFARDLPSGQTVELAPTDDPALIADIESQSTWNGWHGSGVDGPLAGAGLVVLPASTIYTDQFLDYYPDGRIWTE